MELPTNGFGNSSSVKFVGVKLELGTPQKYQFHSVPLPLVPLPVQSTRAESPSPSLPSGSQAAQSSKSEQELKISDFHREWGKMSHLSRPSHSLPPTSTQSTSVESVKPEENPRLKAVQRWVRDAFGKHHAPAPPPEPIELSQGDIQAFFRLEQIRRVVNQAQDALGVVWHLARPRSSWKCKAPYLEPRAEYLSYGLKWPEEYKFSSEEERRKFLKECRKQKDFLYSHLPLWTSIVANLFFVGYVVYDPALPWRNDW